jgi:hypothetical protein
MSAALVASGRGDPLPRDAAAQAPRGTALRASDAPAPLADGAGSVVHASAATGGVCRSPLAGARAEAQRRRETFVGARRLERSAAVAARPGRTG